jgi:hypothetical protein
VAFDHISSLPMATPGLVDSVMSGSLNPNVPWISSVMSNTARISSTSCSGVQMMCESSWRKPRARSSPWSTPGRSYRYTAPSSDSRIGSSRYDRVLDL